MASGAQPSHLLLRGKIYYFRIMVPKSLVQLFGKSEYKKSLGTGDYKAACRLVVPYSHYAERYFKLVEIMKPTRDDIDFLIRNHFERCLMGAEDSKWWLYKDNEEDAADAPSAQERIEGLKEDQDRLKATAIAKDYGPAQVKTAKELLQWRGYDLTEFDDLFKELARGIMNAQLEAKRMEIAFMERDSQGMAIQTDFFKDCRNYLQVPDFDLFMANWRNPYHSGAKGAAHITLDEAVELYFKAKRQETASWHQAHHPYLERMKDILGAKTSLQRVTKEKARQLEEKLWDIPANYVRDHGDTPLQEFLNGKRGEYKKISGQTVKIYWQAIKAFFAWCADQDYMAFDPFVKVTFTKVKSGQKDEKKRRSFTAQELKIFFNGPLYTGHKYENQRLWIPGSLVSRNGNFWIPLVGLFAGLRLGEILYLTLEDLRFEEGVAYLDVNKDGEKSLKNFQSARKIPLHPELKKLGFIEYCKERKEAKKENSWLFDGVLRPQNQKITKNFSRNFGNLITELGLKKDKLLTFHSLRHNYVDALRRVPGINVEIMDPLDGRKTIGMERGSRKNYGYSHGPAELYPYVEQMDLKVDLSHLYKK